MLSEDFKVTNGASARAWIEPRLGGEFGAVTLQVPKGFDAYARVLHPAQDSERNPVSWAKVADVLDSTAHREMQWHALVGSSDSSNFTGSKWADGDPSLGAMDLPTLDSLCEALAAHTSDPAHCHFGLCTIQVWEEQFSADELRLPLLKLPMGRDYIVLTGPLSAIDQIIRDLSIPSPSRSFSFAYKGEGPPPKPDPSFFLRREAPNLIWPGATHVAFGNRLSQSLMSSLSNSLPAASAS